MQDDIQEIYRRTIRPLSVHEKLQLAALILTEISHIPGGADAKAPAQRAGDITRLFGIHKSGDPHGSDNERIDADLARAYADTHEDGN